MTAPVRMRKSATVHADIETLKADRQSAEIRLAELEGTYNDVLLNGDDKAAERHEAETAKQRRAIARADLRLPPLEDEFTRAEEHEAEVALAAKQDAARAAVAAVVKTFPEAYQRLASQMAALMREFADAHAVAVNAGVPGPNDVLRTVPAATSPDETQTYAVWVHPALGVRSDEPRASVVIADRHGRLVPRSENERAELATWRREERTRTIPGKHQPEVIGAYLPGLVSLPGLYPGDDPFWTAGILMRRISEAEAKAPRERRIL